MGVTFVISTYASMASAMSPEQKKIYQLGINYFDICDPSGSSTEVTAGTGDADGAAFPDLDPKGMAKSIDKWIAKTNPNSRMKNLGETIVASGKEADVNPFLIVVIARMESNLGDPSVANVTNARNSFGRTATSSQPNWNGWYKWTTVKASVDSTATENKGAAGGGDMFSYMRAQYNNQIKSDDIMALMMEYAPPGENDTVQYVANIKTWMKELIDGVGGSSSSGGSGGSSNGGTVSGQVSSGAGKGMSKDAQAKFQEFAVAAGKRHNVDPNYIASFYYNEMGRTGDSTNNADAASGTPVTGDGKWIEPAPPIGKGDKYVTNSAGYSEPMGWGAQWWPAYAQDGDNDGKKDLMNLADAMFATGKAVASNGATKGASDAKLLAAAERYNPSSTYAKSVLNTYKYLKGLPSVGVEGSTSTSDLCCPGQDTGSQTLLDGKNNKEKIWNYLVQEMDLTDVQAAGVMGNIQQESNFNPTAVNPDSGAYGIVQWYAGRETALEGFASDKGKAKSDLGLQLEFLKKELNTGYKAKVLDPIKATDKIEKVTRIWLEYYEIPCSPPGSACDAETATRVPFAKKILQDFGGSGSSGSSSSSDGDSGSGCSETSGGDANLMKTETIDTPGKFITLPSKYSCSGRTTRIDSRIAANIAYFVNEYGLCADDGLADGHKSHGAGLAVDMHPREGNSKQAWKDSAEAAAKAYGWWGDSAADPVKKVNGCATYVDYGMCMHEVHPDKFPKWMRWTGYNGDVDHGDPWHIFGGSYAHIHIGWDTPNGDGTSMGIISEPRKSVYRFPAPIPDDLKNLVD